MMNKWYVIQTISTKESEVSEKISFFSNDKIKVIFPKRKLYIKSKGQWINIYKALFPGYIFYEGEHFLEIIEKKKQINGLIKILMDKTYKKPIPLYPDEIELIQNLMNQDEIVDYSQIIKCGDKIKVIAGPLIGQEGIIIKVDKHRCRCKVKLSLLGRELLTDLSIETVER